METINISASDISSLNSAFNKILAEHQYSAETIKHINLLKNFLTEYQNTKEYMHSEIRPELTDIIKTLNMVSKQKAESISHLASSACNSCIFHNENCMINLIFIIFKSIELGKYIDFNKLRPAMRMVF